MGLRGAEPSSIDVGNAGTLLRLLPGWLAGQGRGSWTLDGDESIRRRPVDRVAEPLRLMGASVECREGRLPPLVIEGGELEGIRYELPVASAQVKSCVLLAGLVADGETVVVEGSRSRDHTERMLVAAGAELTSSEGVVSVHGAERLTLGEVTVPADFSSGAFWLAAATLVPGSELTLEAVGLNPTRIGLLRVLERMGADVTVDSRRMVGMEPVAELVVRSAPLSATTVEPGEVPLVIDELPLVALLGTFAEGTTVVTGAAELRHKESDRIATVVEGLGALGARIEARPGRVRGRGRGRAGRRPARRRRRPPARDAGSGSGPCLARRGRPRGGGGGKSLLSRLLRRSRQGHPVESGRMAPARPPRRRAAPAPPTREEIYRRRRIAALVIGAVVFLFLVWAVSSIGGGGSGASADKPKPAELPNGGRILLPRYRLVGYYGAPQHDELGALGIGTPADAARKLLAQAKPYERRGGLSCRSSS